MKYFAVKFPTKFFHSCGKKLSFIHRFVEHAGFVKYYRSYNNFNP